MKVFGREPAAWIGLIEATIAMIVVLGWVTWTNEQVGLIMAVVVTAFGILTAYLTHDTMLGFIVGFVKALFALGVGFGFHLSPELTAASIGFVTVLVGFFQRTQTSPAAVPGFGSS